MEIYEGEGLFGRAHCLPYDSKRNRKGASHAPLLLSSTRHFANRESKNSLGRGSCSLPGPPPPGMSLGCPHPKQDSGATCFCLFLLRPSLALMHLVAVWYLVRFFCSSSGSSFQDQGYMCSAEFQKAELGSTDELECRFQLNRQRPFLRIRLCQQGPGCPGRCQCLVAGSFQRKAGRPLVGMLQGRFLHR